MLNKLPAVLVVKDIIVIYRKNETMILVSLKRYYRILKNQYLT